MADWPSSRITMFVESVSSNTTVSLAVHPAGEVSSFQNFIGVEVNCQLLGKYEVVSTTKFVEFSFESKVGEVYEVSLTKITEASLGAMSFDEDQSSVSGNIVSPSGLVSCHARRYGMLVIGDSITAAYGVEGVAPCTWSADTENVMYSYATLVGERVDAAVHTVAWSGKGVVRNYGDPNPTSPDPMPIFYNRTLGISANPDLFWDPSGFVPDIVMVTLGSNDYSTEPHPSDEDFVAGYEALLAQVRADYPHAMMAAVCEPVPGGNECQNVKTAAASFQATYIQVPDSIYTDPKGCDGHPSIEGQQNIADVVAPVIQSMLEQL